MGAGSHPERAELAQRGRLAVELHLAEGHRQLAMAVLYQAVQDAQSGNGHSAEARAFLANPEARALAEEIGICLRASKGSLTTE